MNRLIAAIVVATGMIAAAAPASAETFTASFQYNNGANAAVNYRAFERTAVKACGVDLKRAGGVAMKRKIEKQCHAQLMADVVARLDIAALTMVHQDRTGTTADTIRLASTR
jgi:hypothetical protein